ncbi:MAG: flavin reductase family protein [Anaerolineaceae bacterium]|nr:flavin reductase family protein [Anaerolineaceae bacterium]
MNVNIGMIQKLSSPNPFGLVSSQMENGETNLMAISWWTYVSNKPATLAICLSKRGYTGELIKKSREFALNIVDESIKEAAFQCGTCSGRSVNKAAKFNIALEEAKLISTKLVKAHKIALECRVVQCLEVSDHDLFVAEILEASLNPEKNQVFAVNGYSSLSTLTIAAPSKGS